MNLLPGLLKTPEFRKLILCAHKKNPRTGTKPFPNTTSSELPTFIILTFKMSHYQMKKVAISFLTYPSSPAEPS